MAERERLELAAVQLQQLGQLGLGGHDHVRRRVATRSADAGDPMDPTDLVRDGSRRRATGVATDDASCPTASPTASSSKVVSTSSPESISRVEIGHGVEEVEGQRRRHGGDRPGTASAADRREDDDEHEDESDVGVEHVVAQRHQGGGDGDRCGTTDGDPQQPRRAGLVVHEIGVAIAVTTPLDRLHAISTRAARDLKRR